MEKPQNFLTRFRRNRLLWNLSLIAAIILSMAVAAHLVMQAGTRHGARRIVPTSRARRSTKPAASPGRTTSSCM